MLCALFAGLALATAFSIHGSSIGVWNQLDSQRARDAGVLLGAPRFIRHDEYGITTLAILSQARARPPFPLENPDWGGGRVPLIFSVPVRHWSMAVRPQFLGFFALDVERGFAFYWAMKTVLLLAGVFLLLLLVTRNDFGVSLLGAAWVYFSGFIQWWYSSPAVLPETVGCVALLVVAAHSVALSRWRWQIAASALVFSLCLVDAILSFYPPFQVPLLHLGLAIGLGSLIPRLMVPTANRRLAFRSGCALAALAGVAVALALYWDEASSTIRLMLHTVYPGTRRASGGEVTFAQIFSGFYGPLFSEGRFPALWINVCEASNFVLLFPVPIGAVLWRAWRRQPVTPLEWSLSAYLLLTCSWLLFGWPPWLARASGFALSQGARSLLGLGLGSILLCCVFLAVRRVDAPAGIAGRVALAAILFAASLGLGLKFQREAGGFVSLAQIVGVSLVAGAAGYALLARQRACFALLVLVPQIWGHGLVNPIATGLGPVLDTKLARGIAPLVASDPDARWAVYGRFEFADLLKVLGVHAWNGTKVVPPLEDLRVLDPSASAWATYNRFAHVSLALPRAPGVKFSLQQPDAYTIEIDPGSDSWRKLGVRYVVLPFEATDPTFLAVARLTATLPEPRLWVYALRSSLESG